MTMRQDMAAACEASQTKDANPQDTGFPRGSKGSERECSGFVVITAQHVKEGDDEHLKGQARRGCIDACQCKNSQPSIETRNGTRVMVARCNGDPNSNPLGDKVKDGR